MSGIKPGVLLTVSRIVVDFRDDIGNLRQITGTGFWIEVAENNYFVTNRHNLDPTLKLGEGTKFRLDAVQLQLRAQTKSRGLLPESVFITVGNMDESLRCHPSSDVAVLKNPSLPSDYLVITHGSFSIGEIANSKFLEESVNPMDMASFIGFPGQDGNGWWDQRWELPISRTVNIASWPRIPFSNNNIPTSDVVLVSGLSFSGSSGSPVLSHEKGIKVGGGLTGGGYVIPKVLGIMSGHWWNEEPKDRMFFHSGLSYFTRATSILELLES